MAAPASVPVRPIKLFVAAGPLAVVGVYLAWGGLEYRMWAYVPLGACAILAMIAVEMHRYPLASAPESVLALVPALAAIAA